MWLPGHDSLGSFLLLLGAAGGGPLSRVEIGGKPPGGMQKGAFPPDPRRSLAAWARGC